MKNYNQTRSFNVGLAADTSVDAALIYDELDFWKSKSKNKWFYKNYEELIERFPFMSEYNIRNAIKQLKNAGIIETKVKKANGSPTLHFRFLKNLRMETEETSETMVSLKTSETNNSNSTSTQNKQKEEAPKDEIKNDLMFGDLVEALGYDRIRTRFTPARRSKLQARLKSFSFGEILNAAKFIREDPFMQGENDNKTKYGDIDYLLRNDEKLEHWANKGPALDPRTFGEMK